MSLSYLEIISRVIKNNYHDEDMFVNIINILSDLDIFSVRNYQEELTLSNTITSLTDEETLTFQEILNKVDEIDISLLNNINTDITSNNPYVTEFILAVKNRVNGTNEVNLEQKIDKEVYIPLDEFAMILFREFRFYSSNNEANHDLLIDSIKDDQLHMFKAFHTSHEIDIEAKNYYNETLIHLAALENSPQIIKYLVENNLDLDIQNDFMQTPLHLAFLSKKVESIHMLVNLGADVNIGDKNGNTALHMACSQNDVMLTKLLLKANGKMNIKNKENLTPFEIAIKYDCAEVIDEFLRVYPKLKGLELKLNPLFFVAHFNAIKVFQLFKKYNYDLNISDKSGTTLLHQAAFSGSYDILKSLIESGFNIDVISKENYTPLHSSVIHGYQDIVQYLIDQGANINLKTKYKFTPVYYAIHYKNYDMVKLLIENGADINSETKKKYVPLHHAVNISDFEIVKLLVESGANVNHRLKKGTTPLHSAIQNGNYDIVKYLLENGANVNAKSRFGIRPIHLAVENNDYEITKLLLEYHALIEVNAIFGKTPLTLAVNKNNLEITKLLIHSKGNLNIGGFTLSNLILYGYGNKDKTTFNYLKSLQPSKYRKRFSIWAFIQLFFTLFLLIYSSYNIYSKISLYSQGVNIEGKVVEINNSKDIKYNFTIDEKTYTYSNFPGVNNSWYSLSKNDYSLIENEDIIQVKYLNNYPSINYPIISTEKTTLYNNIFLISLMFCLGLGYSVYEFRRLYFYRKD